MTSPQSLAALAEPTEAELISRIRQGDPDALSAAYYRHAGPLLTLAVRLLGSGAEAQDVIQDLFVGLPEALLRYEENGLFRAWLRRIVIRMALMRLRAQRRRREVVLEPAIGWPARAPANAADNLDLARAMAQLPDDYRIVVVLKAIEGYSHEEIAGILGIRRNASEVRFHRALERLRVLLEVL